MGLIKEQQGFTISFLELESNKLRIGFSNGSVYEVYDAKQCCCETRYMQLENDILYFIGSIFIKLEIADVIYDNDDKYSDVVEIEFLRLHTDRGIISISNYNAHNGYYSGFDIVVNRIL